MEREVRNYTEEVEVAVYGRWSRTLKTSPPQIKSFVHIRLGSEVMP